MRSFISAIATMVLLAGAAAGAADHRASTQDGAPPWAGAATAMRFAHEVLVSAPLPRGARPWAGQIPSSLARPPATSGVTLDLHRFFVVDEPATGPLEDYVLAHLQTSQPQLSGTSTGPDGESSEFFGVSLATQGQNEYSAGLLYQTSTSAGLDCLAPAEACLLRIDSQTTWEPDRPKSEEIPAGEIARLTGYSSVSAANLSSGPVSVDLGPTQSAALVKALNALPLGPAPDCMEQPLLYTIVFLPPHGPGRQYKVTAWFCAAALNLSAGSEELHPLFDSNCSLFELVRRLVPPSATGTLRAGSPGCGRQFL